MRGRCKVVAPKASLASETNYQSEKSNNDGPNGQTEFVVSEGLKGLNGQFEFV